MPIQSLTYYFPKYFSKNARVKLIINTPFQPPIPLFYICFGWAEINLWKKTKSNAKVGFGFDFNRYG